MPSPSITESNVAPVYRLLTETTGWRKCIITPGRSAAAFVPWDKLVAPPVRLARGDAVKVVTRSGRDEHTATLDGARWPSGSAKHSRLAPATSMSSPMTLTGTHGGRAKGDGW